MNRHRNKPPGLYNSRRLLEKPIPKPVSDDARPRPLVEIILPGQASDEIILPNEGPSIREETNERSCTIETPRAAISTSSAESLPSATVDKVNVLGFIDMEIDMEIDSNETQTIFHVPNEPTNVDVATSSNPSEQSFTEQILLNNVNMIDCGKPNDETSRFTLTLPNLPDSVEGGNNVRTNVSVNETNLLTSVESTLSRMLHVSSVYPLLSEAETSPSLDQNSQAVVERSVSQNSDRSLSTSNDESPLDRNNLNDEENVSQRIHSTNENQTMRESQHSPDLGESSCADQLALKREPEPIHEISSGNMDEIIGLMDDPTVVVVDEDCVMIIKDRIPAPYNATRDDMIKRESDPISGNISYFITVSRSKFILFSHGIHYSKLIIINRKPGAYTKLVVRWLKYRSQ